MKKSASDEDTLILSMLQFDEQLSSSLESMNLIDPAQWVNVGPSVSHSISTLCI